MDGNWLKSAMVSWQNRHGRRFRPPSWVNPLTLCQIESFYPRCSLRSKRFRLVPRKGTFGFDRARNETRAKKWPRSFTCATFLAVFDSRSSFFSPKPYRNACYAGYPRWPANFPSFFFLRLSLIGAFLSDACQLEVRRFPLSYILTLPNS